MCYLSSRTCSSHLILRDLFPSCTSCLSLWSVSCVSITAKETFYYTPNTMAHNGPLFWLDVVERSLVKYISSSMMCPILPFLCPFISCFSLSFLFWSSLWLFSYYFLLLFNPLLQEYFHLSSRLVVEKKTGSSLCKYVGTSGVMISPSVLFLPVAFQST